MARYRRLILSCLALLCLEAARGENDVPLLSGRITDNAALLSPETTAKLTALLKAHEDSTSDQVAVLTINSLDGEPIESYSMRVAETWKLGRRDRDNGVLLIVARDDRKVRIEVGRGLEGNLPDITAGRIIRNVMIPRFKSGDFDGGISAGVEAILGSLEGSGPPVPAEEPEQGMDLGTKLMAGGIFSVVVGLFTRLAAVPLIVDMLVEGVTVFEEARNVQRREKSTDDRRILLVRSAMRRRWEKPYLERVLAADDGRAA